MMAELGDEELSGVTPKALDSDENNFKNFGYWKDERGIRHYGVIPDTGPIVPKFNLWPIQYNDDTGYRTSNQRYNKDALLR